MLAKGLQPVILAGGGCCRLFKYLAFFAFSATLSSYELLYKIIGVDKNV